MERGCRGWGECSYGIIRDRLASVVIICFYVVSGILQQRSWNTYSMEYC